MKTLIGLMFISMLMVFSSPAHSDAIQIFNCEFEGEATEDDVSDMLKKWIKAAKSLKGGIVTDKENYFLELHPVPFPEKPKGNKLKKDLEHLLILKLLKPGLT